MSVSVTGALIWADLAKYDKDQKTSEQTKIELIYKTSLAVLKISESGRFSPVATSIEKEIGHQIVTLNWPMPD